MKFEPTALPGIVKIVPTVHEDSRVSSWKPGRYAVLATVALMLNSCRRILVIHTRAPCAGSITRSKSRRERLVRVVQGAVFDVSVDLRKSSPHFGQWVGEILSAENRHQLWVPPGFGHGFLVLNETAGFQSKCTDYYAPEVARSIRWDDPDIAIDWPLTLGEELILSDIDTAAP